MTIDLSGKTILVTGGGAGLGKALCIGAARAGAKVIVTSHGDNGKATADEAGNGAVWIKCDVTEREDVEAAFDSFDIIHGVVHNATSRLSSMPARLIEVTREEWRDHADVSLTGAFHVAQCALPKLPERDGRLVLMTSPAGMEGSPMNPLYGVVKGGLRGFTKSLAREWAHRGHTVNAVSPLSATEALTAAFANDPSLQPRLATKVPLGWLGDPLVDNTPPVLFLLSEEARYVTGQTLVVDGGRFMNL
ncbi:MAG: short-chain dehydrogenase/reductase [Actinomycetia bacterium]|nr:short-chain dehydrogenase/reductase [Actinomycetes bacterium]